MQSLAGKSTLGVDLGLTGILVGMEVLPLVGLAVVFSFFADAQRVRSAGRLAATAGVLLMLGSALARGVAQELVGGEALVIVLEVGAVITLAGFCSIVVARLRGA